MDLYFYFQKFLFQGYYILLQTFVIVYFWKIIYSEYYKVLRLCCNTKPLGPELESSVTQLKCLLPGTASVFSTVSGGRQEDYEVVVPPQLLTNLTRSPLGPQYDIERPVQLEILGPRWGICHLSTDFHFKIKSNIQSGLSFNRDLDFSQAFITFPSSSPGPTTSGRGRSWPSSAATGTTGTTTGSPGSGRSVREIWLQTHLSLSQLSSGIKSVRKAFKVSQIISKVFL